MHHPESKLVGFFLLDPPSNLSLFFRFAWSPSVFHLSNLFFLFLFAWSASILHLSNLPFFFFFCLVWIHRVIIFSLVVFFLPFMDSQPSLLHF